MDEARKYNQAKQRIAELEAWQREALPMLYSVDHYWREKAEQLIYKAKEPSDD